MLIKRCSYSRSFKNKMFGFLFGFVFLSQGCFCKNEGAYHIAGVALKCFAGIVPEKPEKNKDTPSWHFWPFWHVEDRFDPLALQVCRGIAMVDRSIIDGFVQLRGPKVGVISNRHLRRHLLRETEHQKGRDCISFFRSLFLIFARIGTEVALSRWSMVDVLSRTRMLNRRIDSSIEWSFGLCLSGSALKHIAFSFFCVGRVFVEISAVAGALSRRSSAQELIDKALKARRNEWWGDVEKEWTNWSHARPTLSWDMAQREPVSGTQSQSKIIRMPFVPFVSTMCRERGGQDSLSSWGSRRPSNCSSGGGTA